MLLCVVSGILVLCFLSSCSIQVGVLFEQSSGTNLTYSSKGTVQYLCSNRVVYHVICTLYSTCFARTQYGTPYLEPRNQPEQGIITAWRYCTPEPGGELGRIGFTIQRQDDHRAPQP